jgi:hypothetical protein
MSPNDSKGGTKLTPSWHPALFINRSLQPQDDLTIKYGGPYYWQIFWNHHLSLDQQKHIKIQYPDTIFSPHWPKQSSGYHNQKISNQLESDYVLSRYTQHLPTMMS